MRNGWLLSTLPIKPALKRCKGAQATSVPATAKPVPATTLPTTPICHYRLNKSDAKVALTDSNHFDDQVVYVTFFDLFNPDGQFSAAGRAPRNW